MYPGVPAHKKVQHGKIITLLFVARYFYSKGGKIAVEAIHQLTSQNPDVRGIIISDTPKEVLEKYTNTGASNFWG